MTNPAGARIKLSRPALTGSMSVLKSEYTGATALSAKAMYAPFVLATTARHMDIDATIYFVVKGVTVMKKGEAEKIKMGNFPPLNEVIDQAIEADVKLVACDQSTQVLGIDRGG